MKPHLDIAHEGNLDTDDRTRMSFDQDSVAHLMSILTDLYSDPALAVIREYSTNAFDSHIAAGQTRPIEVELPTHLRPLFVVRDFGTGMTVDQISNQFSKYGWSSKRDSDDAVGMLGLGCKSGLSYTSQFTLVSVHDGVQITVLITREEDGAGAVQIIDTAATDKPNGVEVQIPVKEPSGFNQRAGNFYKFWEPGQILVNGAEPELVGSRKGAISLADDIVLDHVGGYEPPCHIVMGNVPYLVEHLKGGAGRNGYAFVARVPIGTVDFTPSREALHNTKRTLAAIAEIRARVMALLDATVAAEVAAATTPGEAIDVRDKWSSIVLNFKGFMVSRCPASSGVSTRS